MGSEIKHRDLKRRGKGDTLVTSKKSGRCAMCYGKILYNFPRLDIVVFQEIITPI
jgi:hypothetical protein